MDAHQLHILNQLHRRKRTGKKQLNVDDCFAGIRKHEIGLAKFRTKELIQGGYLIAKPTHYGLHVSLNPGKITEIKKLLGV